MMELAPALLEWIESTVGGEIVSVERQGRWRPQFFVDVKLPDGEQREVLVRFPREQGPPPEKDSFAGHFSIEHEANVLAALQGTDVVVPRYYGFHAEQRAILMERLPGTNDLGDIDDDARDTVLREYFRSLAALHTLAIDEGALQGMVVPRTPEELAFANKFAYVERDRARRTASLPEPLLEFALWWLHENVPQHRTIARWVQGDTGPGQFLAHDGHVTALIDWELSHIGDPMIDLGVMRMRNQLYPVGDLDTYLDYYAEVVGEPIDDAALCFYTVLSNLLSPMGLQASIQSPTARNSIQIPSFGWDVTLRRGLCDSLCEAYGVEVTPPTIPEPGPTPRSDLYRYLVDHLETNCLSISDEEFDQFQLRGAIGVAQALELDHAIGRQLEDDDLDDMAAVLGSRPEDREAGLAELSRIVADDPHERELDLLWVFTRLERRRDHLWTPMMIAQESRPFERRYPATRTLDRPPFTS